MLVQIITPDKTAYASEALSVTIPTTAGEITVLAHHVPMISTLAAGSLIVREATQEHIFAVARGVVEIDGASVRILTDIADPADALQEEAIEKAKAAAERLKDERRGDEEGFAEASAMLERELARLKTVRRTRTRSHLPRSSSHS